MSSRRPKGTGSVWRATDGRWRGRAVVSGRTVTVSAPTEPEAQAALTMAIAKALTGDAPARKARSSHPTVSNWAAEWLALCTARVSAGTMKPSTLDGYVNILRLYVLPHLGDVRLTKLTATQVVRWHAELGGRFKPGTVAAAHRVLRAMLREAQRHGHVTTNVAADAGGPRGAEPTHVFLTLDEVGAVLRAFDGSRAAAAVALGLLGLRRGEIAGLCWDDVDLERRTVTIRQAVVPVAGRPVRGTPKRRASFRTIVVDEALVDAVRRWRTTQVAERLKAGPLWTDSGAVITTRHGGAMDPPGMARMMARFVEAACGRSVSPHALRHTSASLMLDSGADLKAISDHLGHGDTSVTERVYAHRLNEARRRGGEALGQALRAATSGDHG